MELPGSFGNVCVVKTNNNNFFYTIKNISCKQILYSHLHENLDAEKAILFKIVHPFIVKIVKTLKDKKYLYFLMDYIKRNEFFNPIRERNVLNQFQALYF